MLPIYYSLYHDENVTVNTLLYTQLLYGIISLENIIMSKKRMHIYTLFVDFLSAPAFLVLTPVPCTRIPGVKLKTTHILYWDKFI